MLERFPVPALADGRRAVISNAYAPPGHLGVDLMFERRDGEPDQAPSGSKGYYCPPGVPALAVGPGHVVYAEKRSRGYAVRLALADRDALYMHLASLSVSEGQKVVAGQVLGTIGADPRDKEGLRHLHFELRTFNRPVDPAGELAGGIVVPWPRLGWGLVALVLVVVARAAGVLG